MITKNIEPLKSLLTSKKIKWVKKENLHLTLCFLGKITQDQFHDIDEKIKNTVKDVSAFTISIKDLKPFPSREKFHVLALNIEPSDPLKNLAQKITQDTSSFKVKAEKHEFKPHVTVARIARECNINSQIFTELEDGNQGNNVDSSLIEIPSISFKATEVKLFESKPDTDGSTYIPVAVYKI